MIMAQKGRPFRDLDRKLGLDSPWRLRVEICTEEQLWKGDHEVGSAFETSVKNVVDGANEPGEVTTVPQLCRPGR